MHVAAYIHPSGLLNPTGVGKHQLNMVTELSRLPGTKVSLLVHRKDIITATPLSKTDLSGLPVITLPGSARLWGLLWSLLGWPTVDRWLPRDVDWIYCPFEAWIPTKRSRFAATIHCDNWFEKDLPWYGNPDIRRARWRLAPVFRRILKKADIAFTVSEFLRDRLVDVFGADKDRLSVVGNGVEDDFISTGLAQMNSVEASWKGSREIWIVAPLVPRKGADAVVGVARHLMKTAPELRILVAGGEKGVVPYASGAEECDNIRLLGYMSGDEIAKRIQGALALLILSRYETFGIPAIEAMAAGVPVIAAKHAALPEVVGDAAILVDPDSPEEVTAALFSLSSDIELRREYIKRGLSRASEFTWRNCAERAYAAMQSKSC